VEKHLYRTGHRQDTYGSEIIPENIPFRHRSEPENKYITKEDVRIDVLEGRKMQQKSKLHSFSFSRTSCAKYAPAMLRGCHVVLTAFILARL